MKKKIIRISTVPMALRYLIPGQMRFIKNKGFDVLMISATSNELADIIKNEQCRHMVVNMTRKITLFQDLKCLLKLIRIFKIEKPDIVHSLTPKAGLLAMLAAKICRIKVRIHDVVGMPLMVETGIKYSILKAVEKITYACATHVQPNSNSLLKFVTEKKLSSAKKLKIIGNGSCNGIDLGRYSKNALNKESLDIVKSKIQYNSNNIYLLFVGRLVSDKGIVELITVFKKLHQKIPNLCLILVGDYEQTLDPLPQDIIDTINNFQPITHITWSNQVEYYMAVSSLFVFPSHREGYPTVLLEAGALELPIICSRVTGNIDVVKDGETGIIFSCNNQEEIENSIVFALKNEEKVKKMAANLLLDIKKYFAQPILWEELLAEYKLNLNIN